MQHLVYLHGFLSSKKSQKAQQTLAFATKHFPALNVHVPELSGNIHKTKQAIDALMNTLEPSQVGFIGSSMGGFLSTYCLEAFCMKNFSYLNGKQNQARAVLINPAVTPVELLANYMGKHINPYTGEVFYIHNQHLTTLSKMHQTKLNHPQNYKVLLQTDDETLDYKLAEEKYKGANLVIEEGGNHSFVNYSSHLPNIFQFLFKN